MDNNNLANDNLVYEKVIRNIVKINNIFPDATLVGGTAVSLYARHRISLDTDFVMQDLKQNFNKVLNTLEKLPGWKTSRILRPILILGSYDGVLTGIRQLRREVPLQTTVINYNGLEIKLPTKAELLRIKGFLAITRNISRDYLDFVAIYELLSVDEVINALKLFDEIYTIEDNKSALKELINHLSNPLPADLKTNELTHYKHLDKKWHYWDTVKNHCQNIAKQLMDINYDNTHKLLKNNLLKNNFTISIFKEFIYF